MGEFAFANLCAEGGLVVTKSTTDVNGWDYLVEFPYQEKFNALNLHGSATECRVQVKATDGKKGKVQVTVSSLRRMATAHMPSFFVFLDYDGLDTYQRAYIAHVDQELIYRTLKRIREFEAKGNIDKLNKSTITIKYNSIHQINPITGQALKNEFLKFIPQGMSKYISSKKSYLERCGFEESAGKIKLTAGGIDNLNDLVDVSLGLKKKASITHFTTHFSRFGIVDANPNLDIKGGFIEMPNLKPAYEGVIGFKTNRFSVGLVFDAKIYFSPFNNALPKEQQKFRLVAKRLEMIFFPYACTFNYDIDDLGKENISILDLKKYYDLIFLLNCSGNNLLINITLNDGRGLEFSANCKADVDSDKKIREALSNAIRLLNYFDVPSDILVDVRDVYKNSELYESVSKFLNVDPGKLNIRVNWESGAPKNSGIKVACVGLIAFPMGDKILSCIYVASGVSKLDGESLYLNVELLNVERKFVLDRSVDFPWEDILKIAEEVGEKYRDDFKVFIEFSMGD